MKRLRIGQIVRKKLSSSEIPIGPWMIVRKTSPTPVLEKVDEEYLMRHTSMTQVVDKERIYIPRHISLSISPEIINCIIKGLQWAVVHPMTAKWKEALLDQPETITFYSINGNKVIVSVEAIAEVISNRARCVKIYIQNIISKCEWT